MKKQYSILLLALLCLFINNAFAQLPQVNFPTNKFVCDFTPWKLVLFDDFNGTSLNNTKWFPFNTNNWDNNDNWCEARLGYPGNHSIHRDENVIVNGGSLKLTVEQKTNTWQCASCNTAGCTNDYWGGAPRTENYTSGYISSHLRFNNGKVETRVKMPNHENSWGTIWFWLGTQVNEVDIAEAWGGRYGAIAANNRPRNTYSTHAWWFDEQNNPYNLPQDMHLPNRYPNQNWWQWLMGSKQYLRQEEWHDYAMEWDTTVVKFYFEGELQKEIWKYYKTRLVPYWDGTNWVWREVREPSTCLMPAGDWKITEGFPYIKDSECKLIFSVGQTSRDKVRSTDGHVGQMEVDYVKVYQRHPENEGHTALCTNPVPQIVGPATMCGGTGYSLSSPAPGGTWSINNDAVTYGGGPAGSGSVLLDRNPNSSHPTTTLSYTYTPGEGCPPVKISKVINTGLIYANVGVVRTWTPLWQRFNLFVDPGISGATYHWKVWYGSSGPTNYYEATGPFITTPKVPNSVFLAPYYLKWEVTIVNSCGPTVVTGLRSNLPFATPMLAKTNTYLMPDASAMYLEAKFDSDSIISQYEQSVNYRVSKQFVPNLNDTGSIAKMIGQIELEELEPFLYFSDRETYTMASMNLLNGTDACTVYPNPTSKSLSVTLSKAFDAKSLTQYVISNLTGKNISKGTLKGDIDVSALPPGIYVLELQQGELREYLKFVRE